MMNEDQGPSKRQRTDAGENGAQALAEDMSAEAGLEQALAVQQEIIELDNESSAAILRVEQEFMQRKRPVFDRRAAALSQVSGFWFNVLVQSSVAPYISDSDKEILKYLTTLDVIADPLSAKYTIQLGFLENQFFTNKTLDRKIARNDDGHSVVECSPVDWREGHDLHNTMSDQNAPMIELYTFLNWFLTEGVYEEAQGDPIAEEIRTRIWPNPLLIYTGDYIGDEEFDVADDDEVADEEEEDGDDDAPDPEEDDEEDDNEDDDEDEDEDDDDEDGGDDDGDDDDEDDAL